MSANIEQGDKIQVKPEVSSRSEKKKKSFSSRAGRYLARTVGKIAVAGIGVSGIFLYQPLREMTDHVKAWWNETPDQKERRLEQEKSQDSIFDDLEKSMDQMKEDVQKKADSISNSKKVSSVDPYEFQYDIDNADGTTQVATAELVEIDNETIALTSLSFSDMAQNAQDMGVSSNNAPIKPMLNVQTPTV